VERHDGPDGLAFVLFGQLHSEAAGTVEAQLLDASEDTVLLDLTHLTVAEPAGLCRLVDRQREEHQAGRQLLVRIAPEQVAQLNQP
jgi:ABC-type transporter Mla MlaB component